jgi:hypothetical protein
VDVGDLAEHAEAVGKALGDEQLPVAFVVQLVTLPLSERRRAAPEVDGDVPDPAAHAADQLGLAGTALEMKAAKDPLARARVVVLDEVAVNARLAPRLGAVGLDEKAAIVSVDDRLEQDHPVELRLEHRRHQPYRRL